MTLLPNFDSEKNIKMRNIQKNLSTLKGRPVGTRDTPDFVYIFLPEEMFIHYCSSLKDFKMNLETLKGVNVDKDQRVLVLKFSKGDKDGDKV